jgi:glycosyltransferase involved in cell wall biosynthesis
MLLHKGAFIFYSFLAITLVQVFYYLWFFRRLAFYQPKVKQQSQRHPVSVIICAKDEEDNLSRNLPGILTQDFSAAHEVIVVNDNSADGSESVLAGLQKAFSKLQVVGLQQEAKLVAGKKYPLTAGINEARHEVLLLTDADCMPASVHWIDKMQAAFTPGIEVVLGYGAYKRMPGLLNKLIRFETFHTALQYFSLALAGKAYMGVGRNLAYRKSVFLKNKGFSSISFIPGGDDDLFINQVATPQNTAVVLDAEAFTVSAPRQTWQDWRRQKNRHYSTGRHYRAATKFILGGYTASLVLFYPLLVLSLVFFDGLLPWILYLIRMAIIGIVWNRSMKTLKEEDLFPWFLLLDWWMFFYYLVFASSVWKKPKKTWN